MSRLTESQNVLIYLPIPVNDSEFGEKKKQEKETFVHGIVCSFAAVAFLKKNRVFSLHDCERGPRTVKNRVFEWKRDLSSSDWHGQEVMGNRISFLGQAFDRVVVCARARR